MEPVVSSTQAEKVESQGVFRLSRRLFWELVSQMGVTGLDLGVSKQNVVGRGGETVLHEL